MPLFPRPVLSPGNFMATIFSSLLPFVEIKMGNFGERQISKPPSSVASLAQLFSIQVSEHLFRYFRGTFISAQYLLETVVRDKYPSVASLVQLSSIPVSDPLWAGSINSKSNLSQATNWLCCHGSSFFRRCQRRHWWCLCWGKKEH